MQPTGERDISRTVTEPMVSQAAGSHATPSISVETLVWGGLLVAAGLIRFLDLDGLPFTAGEAARSYDAVRVAQGSVPDTWQGDLVSAITSYLFRIFGETEFVGRLVPALAGVALVAALWWMRSLISNVGALIAAGLVTLSPLFVLHSRTATAYALGPLLAVIIVVWLFEYLRDPRPVAAFPLIVSLALAPIADAPATLMILVVVLFLALEATVFRSSEPADAWRAFRSSPVQWISALLVVVAALQLGVTRFGTDLDAGLPGLRLLADVFNLPRDSRPANYQLALLLAYDWPLVAAGTAGFLLLAIRFARRSELLPFDRFLLLWTLVAALALTLATHHEAGLLLILLLPLALLSGRLAQALAASVEWGGVWRWWPIPAALASFIALTALLMTEWSSGSASSGEQLLLAATPLACLAFLAVVTIGAPAVAARAALSVSAVVALVFMAHSSLAVAFGDGAEFAVDARLTPRVEQLKMTLDRLTVERNSDAVIDADLSDELGWALRDSRVVFGGDPTKASILVTRPGAAPSFAVLPDTWLVAERWYPEDVLAPRRIWRWMIYREAFGPIETIEVRIHIRTI